VKRSKMTICSKCGLPEELCVCQEIAKEAQKIRISVEKRKYRKAYTLIYGFDKSVDLSSLAKELKRKLACGGTHKKNRIELQGYHKDKVKKILLKMGYEEDQIDMF